MKLHIYIYIIFIFTKKYVFDMIDSSLGREKRITFKTTSYPKWLVIEIWKPIFTCERNVPIVFMWPLRFPSMWWIEIYLYRCFSPTKFRRKKEKNPFHFLVFYTITPWKRKMMCVVIAFLWILCEDATQSFCRVIPQKLKSSSTRTSNVRLFRCLQKPVTHLRMPPW